MNNLLFRMMALEFAIRDHFSPPDRTLAEIGIQKGWYVLDYGCGPGGHSIAAAERVGAGRMVYALDIHPLAVEQVRRRAAMRGLRTVETNLFNRATGPPDESGDLVLLSDTLHDLNDPDGVLRELHRALKPGGILSFRDKRLKEHDLMPKLTGQGRFELSSKGQRTYTFIRVGR